MWWEVPSVPRLWALSGCAGKVLGTSECPEVSIPFTAEVRVSCGTVRPLSVKSVGYNRPSGNKQRCGGDIWSDTREPVVQLPNKRL